MVSRRPEPTRHGRRVAELSSAETIYYVMSHGRPIGISRLEFHDSSMGVALGAFEPLPAYDEVQPVFQLVVEAEDAHARGEMAQSEDIQFRCQQARDALDLTLQSADGSLIPTSFIHIIDYGDVGREIHAHITDPAFWMERS